MYNGQTRFTGARRRVVVNRRTGIAGVVGDDSDELSEVAVTAKFVATPPKYEPPDEYPMAEVVVQGSRIPWWAWAIAGSLALTALSALARK
jgi:hypothetical protein